LTKGGINRKAVAFATEYLLQTLSFDIEGDTVFVVWPHGRQSLQEAIAAWVRSPEAAILAPNPKPIPGPFAEAIKRLH
jgi:hypothetical protein